MNRISRLTVILFTLAASFVFTGCPKQGCEDGVPAMLLDYTGLSGCNWILLLQTGERLEPVNLHEFDIAPKDSMLVHITYTEAQTMMSICMVGKMVEITCITELSDDYKDQFINSVSQNRHEPQKEPPSGVMAYPNVISYRLPDGYILKIYLSGDEHNHTTTTKDGYPLMMNQEGFYEYAVFDKDGRFRPSGIIARNKEDRDDKVSKFLKNITQ